MHDVFVTGSGSFLPGTPVDNREMEGRIGLLGPHSRRLKAATLRQNGIQSRHYAIDAGGNHLFTNAAMAARAVEAACDRARVDCNSLDYLAASTTQGDMLVPGHASAVHGELGRGQLELGSFQSVCGSSMMAIKSAYLNLRAGEHRCAAACGSEFSSRWFQPGFYDAVDFVSMGTEDAFRYEFLRWTLSDGAGALLLETEAQPGPPCLRIDWIEQKSFADRFPACMSAGSSRLPDGGERPWSHFGSPVGAAEGGAFPLRQDFHLLERMFPVWVGYYLEVLERRGLDPARVRYFLPHYSARALGQRMQRLLEKAGAMIPEDRWRNHQDRVGNVGSASIFLLLDRLLREEELREGDRVLCFVPESGRCLAAFMCLTVV
ncbi:3-oxoacyl-[acyl-carrier-protein] synthase III C-terminal domain-containing protein [Microbulbifer sediminum]|uniref:3-oxoacyl-[acyl-carrier-protein] synthase III C-terminal domain-containing protein n=1 Tax=Microbulbifer sediminum TaxID=2904250 RepID=UPI001F3B1422|nr:3-oxoacyl-[acyl-carrier-protein] synthase III C-terminal domain-containing protein [Microbulbifer sediminum]